jgi:hypothetical protein
MERADPVTDAGDRTALEQWLDYHRATVRLKCAGLDEMFARQAPVRTSPLLSPAGLVAHLTDNEQYWFEAVLHDGPRIAADDDDPDADWVAPEGMLLPELLDRYDAQCARSRELTAGLDLSFVARRQVDPGGRPMTLRWIYLHQIEETARHNGHLDIVRELLDGATGA